MKLKIDGEYCDVDFWSFTKCSFYAQFGIALIYVILLIGMSGVLVILDSI